MFNRLYFVTFLTISACLVVGCSSEEQHEYQGYVDGDLTFIASPFSGVLEQLNVKEGDTVEKDKLLVQLDLEPQQSQYKQAQFALESAKNTLENLKKGERATVVEGIEAEIAKATSELELARVRMERTKSVYEKRLIDKDTYDQAVTEYNTKSDTLKQLGAKLQEAKLGGREDVVAAQEALVQAAAEKVDELAWSLNSKKLSAPDEGYIVDIFYRQGEFVPTSKPIMSMLIPINQYVVFFLPLAKIQGISLGDSVDIDCEGCKQPYKAVISYISPKVEFTPPLIFSRQHQDKYVYRLHAKLDNEGAHHLHLGEPVYITLKGEG